MIYLVSNNKKLFNSEYYEYLDCAKAIEIIESWEQIQFDTETTGRDPHICKLLCLQFGNRKADTQIVVDTDSVDVLLFKNILETKLLIGHNLKFDIQFLFQYEIIPTQIWDTMIVEQFLHLGFDNKFFHYSLKDVAKRYLNIDIDKTVREEISSRGLDDRVIIYAAGDVQPLEDIMDKEYEACIQSKSLVGAKIENAFVPIIAYLEWCGIKLDIEKWKIKIEDNENKKNKAKDILNSWVISKWKDCGGNETTTKITKPFTVMKKENGECIFYEVPKNLNVINPRPIKIENPNNKDEYSKVVMIEEDWPWITINRQGDLFSGFDLFPKCTINWDSSKQVIPFIQMLGFKTKTLDKKTGQSKHSCSAKILNKQIGIEDEFLKAYIDYKEAMKECSTYGQNYIDAINPKTGRIHTTFWQLGAASGRMSCGSSNSNEDLARLKGIPNSCCKYVQLQNLPADKITRSSFISEKGNLMTSCDFSALESRLGADIYQEPEMINEFLYGSGDMHSLCAKLVFHEELEGVDIKDIKHVRPDLRQKVKPIEFSQQFGGGAGAVADQLGCSTSEAKKFVEAYANGFKGISKFKKIGSAFVRSHGYIVMCKYTGHKMYWEDWKKWREIEDLPHYIYDREFTEKEKKEHDGAGAKWDRLALNAVTQGSGIIILKIAMIAFFKWICKNNLFNIVLLCDLIHDEAVIEYPESMKDLVVAKLKEAMEKAADKICKSVPIPANPETGLYWIH